MRISGFFAGGVIAAVLAAHPGTPDAAPASGAGRSNSRSAAGGAADSGSIGAGRASEVGRAKGDSLESLRDILQKEFKSKERIFRLRQKNLADSILRGAPYLTLPQVRLLTEDSARTEEIRTEEGFRRYWDKVEAENGIAALKRQYAARDPDRSRIPKIYLADSAIVILPGWIVLRRR